MHRIARVGLLPLVFLAACARHGPGPSQSPPAAMAPPAPVATTPAPPSQPPAAQVASTPAAQPAPTPATAQAPSATAAPPSKSKAAAAKAKPKPSIAAKAPAAEEQRAAPPPEKPAAAEPAAAEPVAQQPPPPPALDLPALEDRLRNTHAIGTFTKLSLKNNVDDLLMAFRAFYNGTLRTTLADLRQRYESLFMKVLTLLQNGDPTLAQAVASSRDAIWGILSDRQKFQQFSH